MPKPGRRQLATRPWDDLDYLGWRDTGTTGMHETLTVGQRADRLRGNLGAFVVRVRTQPQ